MNSELAPVALFVYNRPEHTLRTLESLAANELADKTLVYIFSDGPRNYNDEKKVGEVRSVIKNEFKFNDKIIFESDRNKGLAKSIIEGVTYVLNSHGRAIVLEDDLVSSVYFLSFMNNALNYYSSNPNIYSVTGFCYPVQIPQNYMSDLFAVGRPSSWGWGTWKDRWEKVDWEIKDFALFKKNKQEQKHFNKCGNDLTPMLFAQMTGRIDSWAVRWAYSHFKNNALCVFPVKALISHIGSDRSGTHFKSTTKFDVILENKKSSFDFVNIHCADPAIELKVKKFFNLSPVRRIINFFKYFFMD